LPRSWRRSAVPASVVVVPWSVCYWGRQPSGLPTRMARRKTRSSDQGDRYRRCAREGGINTRIARVRVCGHAHEGGNKATSTHAGAQVRRRVRGRKYPSPKKARPRSNKGRYGLLDSPVGNVCSILPNAPLSADFYRLRLDKPLVHPPQQGVVVWSMLPKEQITPDCQWYVSRETDRVFG